jgi:uncharacterized membrane protein
MSENSQLIVTPQEAESGKGMAIVAYLVFFVPFLIDDAKKNRFVMYHTEQAIVLLIVNLAVTILGIVTCGFGFILSIPVLVFYVLGIINAVNGEAKPLPLIGQFGEKLNLVKNLEAAQLKGGNQ